MWRQCDINKAAAMSKNRKEDVIKVPYYKVLMEEPCLKNVSSEIVLPNSDYLRVNVLSMLSEVPAQTET